MILFFFHQHFLTEIRLFMDISDAVKFFSLGLNKSFFSVNDMCKLQGFIAVVLFRISVISVQEKTYFVNLSFLLISGLNALFI